MAKLCECCQPRVFVCEHDRSKSTLGMHLHVKLDDALTVCLPPL